MKKPCHVMLLPTLLILLALSAPAFGTGVLRGFDGSFQSLDSHTGKGKWLIVMLWASDCPACSKEAPAYTAFHQRHKDTDATVLGVSIDGLDNRPDAEAFIKRHNIAFPNLIESPAAVTTLYRELTGEDWVGTPTFLIYSPAGELKAKQVGAVPVNVVESFIQQNSR